MKLLKIDITKINKDFLFRGAKGVYLDAIMKDRPDIYGNDGFIAQSVPREKRARNPQGPIIGHFRELEEKLKPVEPTPVDDDQITF